jgi:hypothetical protein
VRLEIVISPKRASRDRATQRKEPSITSGDYRATIRSEKGGAMPSRTDVMVWGMVVVLMCMIAIDIVRTQV